MLWGIASKKICKNFKKAAKKDFIILPSLQSIFIKNKIDNKFLNLGAQDCSQFSLGSYTGDVSASMVKRIRL